MNTNLITYDMENFLEKYTRFMTKDIYIKYDLYENFLKQYNYLYEELEKNAILFRENIKYKKIMNIKKNSDNLLKLHNQKYLKKAISKSESFFSELGYEKVLDINKKAIVLADEDNLVFLNNKRNIELITAKVKYLTTYGKVSMDKILVLMKEYDDKINLEFKQRGIIEVIYRDLKYYEDFLLGERKIATKKDKFNILFEFLTENLFLDKKKFEEVYSNFSNYIYLSDEYREFDTFKDYHNYFFKKAYLTSNLPLAKFIDNEIEKRKTYLRTLDNASIGKKGEVDVANFLTLNGISYKYQDGVFEVSNNDKKSFISFVKKDDGNDNIYLEKKELFGNNYVEKLVFELIKRKYSFKLLSDDEVYEKLRDTNVHNYFNVFIKKILIPIFDYYDLDSDLSNTKLDDRQKSILVEIYDCYKKLLSDENLVTEGDFKLSLERELKNYKYVITDIDYYFDSSVKCLKIIDDYSNRIKNYENVKLLYDYKNYLSTNSKLPIKEAYCGIKELEMLTDKFEEDYLLDFKKSEEILKKKISIYFYDDKKRILINKKISKLMLDVLREREINNGRRKSKDIIVGVSFNREIDNLVIKNCFSKYDKSSLLDFDGNIISYAKIDEIKNGYKKIILPNLVGNCYDDLLLVDNIKEIEKVLYTTLNKCGDEVVLFCPKSQKDNFKKQIKNKNICFVED